MHNNRKEWVLSTTCFSGWNILEVFLFKRQKGKERGRIKKERIRIKKAHTMPSGYLTADYRRNHLLMRENTNNTVPIDKVWPLLEGQNHTNWHVTFKVSGNATDANLVSGIPIWEVCNLHVNKSHLLQWNQHQPGPIKSSPQQEGCQSRRRQSISCS